MSAWVAVKAPGTQAEHASRGSQSDARKLPIKITRAQWFMRVGRGLNLMDWRRTCGTVSCCKGATWTDGEGQPPAQPLIRVQEAGRYLSPDQLWVRQERGRCAGKWGEGLKPKKLGIQAASEWGCPAPSGLQAEGNANFGVFSDQISPLKQKTDNLLFWGVQKTKLQDQRGWGCWHAGVLGN